MDVIERAIAALTAVVAVVDNPSKESLFSVAERISLLEDLFGERAEIGSFTGLLVEYATQVGADVVVKGLRTVDDYEYEMQMSQMNRHLTGMETVFMATRSGGELRLVLTGQEVANWADPSMAWYRAVEKALQERLT